MPIRCAQESMGTFCSLNKKKNLTHHDSPFFSSPNATCTGLMLAQKLTAIWSSAFCERTFWPRTRFGPSAFGPCEWPTARRTASCLPKRPLHLPSGRCTSTTSRHGPTMGFHYTLYPWCLLFGIQLLLIRLMQALLWFIAGDNFYLKVQWLINFVQAILFAFHYQD